MPENNLMYENKNINEIIKEIFFMEVFVKSSKILYEYCGLFIIDELTIYG